MINLSISGKSLTDIINMTYSCHVGSAMICTECEREALHRNEDRQADRDIVNLTAGRKDKEQFVCIVSENYLDFLPLKL